MRFSFFGRPLLALSALFIAQPVVVASDAVTGRKGMVVCVSPPAAEIGVEVLKSGGNAVDASIAVAFAMAVSHPAAGNIGGGGFMLVLPQGAKQPTVIEYREKAPKGVKNDTFVNDTSADTHRAVGVPGTVRGMALAHKRFGKLSWKALLMPAVKLAEEGFVVDDPLARSLNTILNKTKKNREFIACFGKKDGTAWKAGDRFVQEDLGKTLRKIAEEGPDAFYQGELADLLANEMKQGGGFITKDDLAAYRAVERKPIQGTYRGFDVYGPPPPSSGGICLIEMLNITEQFDIRKHERWSAETCHIMIESMRRAFLDRARYLGDPDFTKIPDHLTSKAYAKKLAGQIDLTKATPSATLADDIPLSDEKDSTTHFSVIDSDGTCVSNTYTLEDSYGSKIVVKGAGYLLNNEMGDFNWKPGITTRKGVIGTTPNLVEPGKRMLSCQTPVIILKDGKPFLITGSPGGRTIINTVYGIVVNVIDFEMNLSDAVDAPRLHQQWFPDEVAFERMKQYPALVAKLNSMGHVMKSTKTQGDAHSIWIDPKTGIYHGVADKRINGKAAGY